MTRPQIMRSKGFKQWLLYIRTESKRTWLKNNLNTIKNKVK